MFEKTIQWFYKNLKYILIATTAFFVAGSIYLALNWNKEARGFGDNILIEFFIGGLFMFVPILLGVYIGKKAKELHFYDTIKSLLASIKTHRVEGGIQKQAARDIVIEFSKTIEGDILEKDWLNRLCENKKSTGSADCGICGLSAETVKANEGTGEEKCKYCKLNCFAWKTLD